MAPRSTRLSVSAYLTVLLAATLPLAAAVNLPSHFSANRPGPRGVEVARAAEKCGDAICAPGTTCCNPLNGTCVPPDSVCTLEGPDTSSLDRSDDNATEAAAAQEKTKPCGPNVCEESQVCCNESCGICTAPGGFCTQQFCSEPAPA